mmetsp:Transcript_12501/g.23913  ORF Transcript_12501/g.23913 Transcript_12501/m.23913 type:complete len:220 (-) Transcript_12501:485-1144(-)
MRAWVLQGATHQVPALDAGVRADQGVDRDGILLKPQLAPSLSQRLRARHVAGARAHANESVPRHPIHRLRVLAQRRLERRHRQRHVVAVANASSFVLLVLVAAKVCLGRLRVGVQERTQHVRVSLHPQRGSRVVHLLSGVRAPGPPARLEHGGDEVCVHRQLALLRVLELLLCLSERARRVHHHGHRVQVRLHPSGQEIPLHLHRALVPRLASNANHRR